MRQSSCCLISLDKDRFPFWVIDMCGLLPASIFLTTSSKKIRMFSQSQFALWWGFGPFPLPEGVREPDWVEAMRLYVHYNLRKLQCISCSKDVNHILLCFYITYRIIKITKETQDVDARKLYKCLVLERDWCTHIYEHRIEKLQLRKQHWTQGTHMISYILHTETIVR